MAGGITPYTYPVHYDVLCSHRFGTSIAVGWPIAKTWALFIFKFSGSRIDKGRATVSIVFTLAACYGVIILHCCIYPKNPSLFYRNLSYGGHKRLFLSGAAVLKVLNFA